VRVFDALTSRSRPGFKPIWVKATNGRGSAKRSLPQIFWCSVHPSGWVTRPVSPSGCWNGYSVPAQGSTYWNGAAMESTDYNDLDEVPEAVASATAAAARNAAHLARALQSASYPPYE
jgi:hypothetical protein